MHRMLYSCTRMATVGGKSGFRQVGTTQKHTLGFFLGRIHAKKTHWVLNPVGFFTLSFSHVKKQMKT